MAKLSIFLGAILLLMTLNLSEATYRQFPLNLVDEAIENLGKAHDILLCMARTCDPMSVMKAFQADDAFEASLMNRSAYHETKASLALELVQAIAKAIPMLLKLEPSCNDVNYSCPTPAVVQAPPEFFQYANYMEVIRNVESCITMANVQSVIDMIGDAANFIEHNPVHGGTSIHRIMPALAHVANELPKLCKA